MLPGIQLLAILFGLIMVYMTFLYYKRGNYGSKAFLFWMFVWGIFIFVSAFPNLVYGIMDLLAIQRTADFLVSATIMVFSVVLFKLYVRNKELESKIDVVVRKVAMDKAYRKRRK